MSTDEIRSQLLRLSLKLGESARDLAILGEGNTSAKIDDDRFLVKASGRSLSNLDETGLVECRAATILELMDWDGLDDDAVEKALYACRVDEQALKPSVETLFHAWLLTLPGVHFVGHTHPVAVNQILCSPLAADFAGRRLFPDEVVCCGVESAFVDYVDPGLELCRAIRDSVTEFQQRHHGLVPRVILLKNHGFIAMGATPGSVEAATFMAVKAARIFAGAAAMGGPVFMPDNEVRRIAGRTDEHYRQKMLKL